MKSNVLIVLLMVLGMGSTAQQVVKVDLQASGLTCSMCSNAIHKALRSLEFVDKVDANIKNSSFAVSFKPGAEVDFERMKAKVEGAGFFVARFLVTMNFGAVKTLDDHCVFVGNTSYRFVNLKEKFLEGDKTFRILDKGFLPAKEFKKNAGLNTGACYDRLEQTPKKAYVAMFT